MGYTSVPTNALNQAFLEKMVFSNQMTRLKAFSKVLGRIKKSVLNGDDLEGKVIVGDGYQWEYAGGGAAVGSAGSLKISEYPYYKKTVAIPIDFNIPALYDLDPENNPKDAVTIQRFFDRFFESAYTMMEWCWTGDGSGAVAALSTTAIVNGTVYLASTTPKIVFDKLLSKGKYVTVGTISSGAVTEQAVDSTNYKLRGYIVSNSYDQKTITISTASTDTTGYSGYDVASVTASQYVFYAQPMATVASTTASTYIMSGYGTGAVTDADSESFYQMHGLLKLNEYHSAVTTYKLYGVQGYSNSEFQPYRLAGSSTNGLKVSDLQSCLNAMSHVEHDDLMLMTDNIIWTDWCEAYRQGNTYVIAQNGPANVHAGFLVNGTVVPMDIVPYWDGKGLLHGIDTSTLHIIYSKSKFLKAAGNVGEPGWDFRFPDVLHQSSAYYGAGNQLLFRGNLVSDGRRNRNFVIDSLQTSYLSLGTST